MISRLDAYLTAEPNFNNCEHQLEEYEKEKCEKCQYSYDCEIYETKDEQ